jgi:hypothetical protein
MVNGLAKFKEYFDSYSDNYVIIGGTACDIIMDDAGFIPRTTKDIDIILVIEALNSDFVKMFWQFVVDGNYEKKEHSGDQRKYYRFMNPENHEFPYQIELFSKKPDLIVFNKDSYLTPIPVDEDLSSLSAILLSEEYYSYLIEHSVVENGLHLAKTEALICLKAKAFLEISTRIEEGSNEDKKHLRKHKNDIFRLTVMLAENDLFILPETIKANMQDFANLCARELPDNDIFKIVGMTGIKSEKVLEQIIKTFNLKG